MYETRQGNNLSRLVNAQLARGQISPETGKRALAEFRAFAPSMGLVAVANAPRVWDELTRMMSEASAIDQWRMYVRDPRGVGTGRALNGASGITSFQVNEHSWESHGLPLDSRADVRLWGGGRLNPPPIAPGPPQQNGANGPNVNVIGAAPVCPPHDYVAQNTIGNPEVVDTSNEVLAQRSDLYGRASFQSTNSVSHVDIDFTRKVDGKGWVTEGPEIELTFGVGVSHGPVKADAAAKWKIKYDAGSTDTGNETRTETRTVTSSTIAKIYDVFLVTTTVEQHIRVRTWTKWVCRRCGNSIKRATYHTDTSVYDKERFDLRHVVDTATINRHRAGRSGELTITDILGLSDLQLKRLVEAGYLKPLRR